MKEDDNMPKLSKMKILLIGNTKKRILEQCATTTTRLDFLKGAQAAIEIFKEKIVQKRKSQGQIMNKGLQHTPYGEQRKKLDSLNEKKDVPQELEVGDYQNALGSNLER